MPKYAVTVGGQTYEVSSDRELSDAEAHQAAVGGESGPKPIDSSSGDSWWGAFGNSLLDTAKKTGGGILEGLNPVNAVKDLAHSVAHPIDTVKGMANTVLHPMDTLDALSDPETGGKAIGSLLLGGAMGRAVPAIAPKVPGAMQSVGRGLESVGDATKKFSPLGVAESAFRGDPMGLGAAAAPYAGKYSGKGLQKLGSMLEGLGGDGEAAGGVERYAPNRSRVSSEVPGSSFPREVPSDPLPTATQYERYSPNQSGSVPDLGAEAVNPTRADIANPSTTAARERLYKQANPIFKALESEGTFGADAARANSFTDDARGAGIDRKMNEISSRWSKEPRPAAPAPKPSPWEADVPEFTYEAGQADVPGLSVDMMGDAPAEALTDRPSYRTLDRQDDFWGPDAKTRTGEPAQAGPMKGDPDYVPKRGGANLLYDPQTPTSYLREQLRNTPNDDAAVQNFLLRGLQQRYDIANRSMGQ